MPICTSHSLRCSCNSNGIKFPCQEMQDLSPFPESRRNEQSQTRRKTIAEPDVTLMQAQHQGSALTREEGEDQSCFPPSDPTRDT